TPRNLNPRSAKLPRKARRCERVRVNLYPQGESNPCFRTENPESWATRRWGPVRDLAHSSPSAGRLSRSRECLHFTSRSRCRDGTQMFWRNESVPLPECSPGSFRRRRLEPMGRPNPRSRKGPAFFFVQGVILVIGAADRWGSPWAVPIAGLAFVSFSVTVVLLVRERIR